MRWRLLIAWPTRPTLPVVRVSPRHRQCTSKGPKKKSWRCNALPNPCPLRCCSRTTNKDSLPPTSTWPSCASITTPSEDAGSAVDFSGNERDNNSNKLWVSMEEFALRHTTATYTFSSSRAKIYKCVKHVNLEPTT